MHLSVFPADFLRAKGREKKSNVHRPVHGEGRVCPTLLVKHRALLQGVWGHHQHPRNPWASHRTLQVPRDYRMFEILGL